MGKTRNKDHSEVEYLRGKVKKLESENRHLKKKIKQLDRQSHFYDDLVDSLADNIEVPETNKCTKCKGDTKLLDLKYIKYLVCDKCDHREKCK